MLPTMGKGPQGRGSIIFDHEGAPCTDSKYHRHCRGRWRGVLSKGFGPALGEPPGHVVACLVSELPRCSSYAGDRPEPVLAGEPQHWVVASFEHHTSPHGLPRPHIHNIAIRV